MPNQGTGIETRRENMAARPVHTLRVVDLHVFDAGNRPGGTMFKIAREQHEHPLRIVRTGSTIGDAIARRQLLGEQSPQLRAKLGG